jgi:hypothetical protein
VSSVQPNGLGRDPCSECRLSLRVPVSGGKFKFASATAAMISGLPSLDRVVRRPRSPMRLVRARARGCPDVAESGCDVAASGWPFGWFDRASFGTGRLPLFGCRAVSQRATRGLSSPVGPGASRTARRASRQFPVAHGPSVQATRASAVSRLTGLQKIPGSRAASLRRHTGRPR